MRRRKTLATPSLQPLEEPLLLSSAFVSQASVALALKGTWEMHSPWLGLKRKGKGDCWASGG